MIQLFVTDLDGTLLDKHKRIDLANQHALSKIAQSGLQICLATGRNELEIEEAIEDQYRTSHRISQNGAQIYTVDGKLLRSAMFESDLAYQVYQTAELSGLFDGVIVDGIVKHTYGDEMKRFFETKHRPHLRIGDSNIFEETNDIARKIGTSMFPTKFSYFGSIAKLKMLERNIQQKFPGKIDSFIVDKNCLDFMPKNINKGTALHVLLKHLRLRSDQIACVGDSHNDLSMFELTPYCFAMKSAPEEVKNQANYIVTSVAEAARHVLQLNQSFKQEKI